MSAVTLSFGIVRLHILVTEFVIENAKNMTKTGMCGDDELSSCGWPGKSDLVSNYSLMMTNCK